MMKKISGKNEDMFRLVLENNPYPMWIYDHETLQFLEVNPAAVAKYGYKRRDFLKMRITEIRPQDHISRLLAEHKKFRMNSKHIGEWTHVLKDGSLIDVAITAYPLYFGNRNAILVQAQDITERKRTQEALRKLAVMQERNRIAREIHDTLAQAFTGILVQLEAARDVIAKNKTAAKSHLARAQSLARKSLAEARYSVSALRPHELEKGDLSSAIRALAGQAHCFGTRVEFTSHGTPRSLPHEIENNLLRIGQEALTNIIRHAGAKRIKIKLNFWARKVQLILQDDGKGFDSRQRRTGFGLVGMQERAERIGATLLLSSSRGNGSQIVLDVPAE
jgi:PAS domain S-box-containing protein